MNWRNCWLNQCARDSGICNDVGHDRFETAPHARIRAVTHHVGEHDGGELALLSSFGGHLVYLAKLTLSFS